MQLTKKFNFDLSNLFNRNSNIFFTVMILLGVVNVILIANILNHVWQAVSLSYQQKEVAQKLVEIKKSFVLPQKNLKIETQPAFMWKIIYNFCAHAKLELLNLKAQKSLNSELIFQAQGGYSQIMQFLNKLSVFHLILQFNQLKILKNQNGYQLLLRVSSQGIIINKNSPLKTLSSVKDIRLAGYLFGKEKQVILQMPNHHSILVKNHDKVGREHAEVLFEDHKNIVIKLSTRVIHL